MANESRSATAAPGSARAPGARGEAAPASAAPLSGAPPASRAATPQAPPSAKEKAPAPDGAYPARPKSLRSKVLVAVAVLYVGCLLAAPAGMLLWAALRDGAVAFARALVAPDVIHALWMTAALTAIAVAVNTVFGTAVAWVLARDRFVGRRVLNALVDVPFAVSPVIAGFVLIELFGRGGLFAPIADALGVRLAFSWPAMAIATTFVSLPFVVREVGPVLVEVGTDQEMAAYSLGASTWTTFRRVTLPTIRWGIAYGVTLTAARAIGEFGAVLVVSGGVAGSTETATTFVYRAVEDRNDIGSSAVAVVLALASIGLLLAMDAMKRRRETSQLEEEKAA